MKRLYKSKFISVLLVLTLLFSTFAASSIYNVTADPPVLPKLIQVSINNSPDTVSAMGLYDNGLVKAIGHDGWGGVTAAALMGEWGTAPAIVTSTTPNLNKKVTKIACGRTFSAALREDGTVIMNGKGTDYNTQRVAVSQWTGIIDILALGQSGVVGLKADGTVITAIGGDFTTGIPLMNAALRTDEKYIKITGTQGHVVGLTNQGRCIAGGNKSNSKCGPNETVGVDLFPDYTIVDVAAGLENSFALDDQGKIHMIGKVQTYTNWSSITSWEGVTKIKAHGNELLAWTADGFLTAGANKSGVLSIPYDFSEVEDIVFDGMDTAISVATLKNGLIKVWGNTTSGVTQASMDVLNAYEYKCMSLAYTSTPTSSVSSSRVVFPASAVDQSINFTIPSVPAGEYNIFVVGYGDYETGTFKLSANGTPTGLLVDYYNGSSATYTGNFGRVTLAEGDQTITLTSVAKNPSNFWKGKFDTIRLVKVDISDPNTVQNVQISSVDDATITTTETLQLTAAVTPSTAYNKAITWTSTNLGLVTVSTNGLVTPVSTSRAGTAIITAYAQNGYAVGTYTVTVIYNTLTAITVTSGTGANVVGVGAKQAMKLTLTPAGSDPSVTWSRVNGTGTATIDTTGNLTGGAPGTVTVYATSKSNASIVGSCEVTVYPAVTGITAINSTDDVTSIITGSYLQMSAVVAPSNAYQSVKWTVTNSGSNASINVTTGLLTAGTAAGTATVKAESLDSSTAKSTTKVITITAGTPVASIAVDSTGSVSEINTFSSLQMTATVLPANATNPAVKWTVENLGGAAATISQTGLLDAGATAGTVTVKATAKDGSLVFGSKVMTILLSRYKTGIECKTNPTITNYEYGQDFDVSGAVISLVYSNGDREDVEVTADMVSGYNKNQIGAQSLIVSYDGFTTSFDVTVTGQVNILFEQSQIVTTLIDNFLTITISNPSVNYKYQYWSYQKISDDLIDGYNNALYQWVKIEDYTTSKSKTCNASNAADQNGNYKIMVRVMKTNGDFVGQFVDNVTQAEVGVVEISNILVQNKITTGIEHFKKSVGVITVKINAENVSSYSLMGCASTPLDNGSFTIDLSTFLPGAYTIVAQANGENGSSVRKSFTLKVYEETVTEIYPQINQLDVVPAVSGSPNLVKININTVLANGTLYTYSLSEPNRQAIKKSNGYITADSETLALGEKQYGVYYVAAYAKRNNAVNYDDGIRSIYNFKRPGAAPALNVSVSGAADVNNVPLGSTIRVTANGSIPALSAGETMMYSFWRNDANGFTLCKDWSNAADANQMTWKPAKAGKYSIQVRAKGSFAGSYEILKNIDFIVDSGSLSVLKEEDITLKFYNAETGVEITGNLTARTPVKVVAAVPAGNELSYKFIVGDAQLGAYEINKYSPDNTVVWTPRKATAFEVKVFVRSYDSFGVADVIKSVSITAN